MTNEEQVRLNIGDTDPDEKYLADSTITFLLQENGNNILDASIDALTAIINQIALQPERWRIGDASESRADVDQLENRLQDLKNKRDSQKYKAVPILLHSDRTDWDDLDKIFD